MSNWKQNDPERAKHLESLTLEQAQSHNAIHEALLMNGYQPTFHPEEVEDRGDGETGPMVWHCPAYFEYENGEERVITQAGTISMREKRDPAFEAWLAAQDEANNTDLTFEGDHDVGPLSFAVRFRKQPAGYYYQMAHETKEVGPFPTSEGAYLAAIGE
jgi:hypothetical protein